MHKLTAASPWGVQTCRCVAAFIGKLSAHCEAASVEFLRCQSSEDYAFTLARTVLNKLGKLQVPVRWFPNRFYPQSATDELLWVNALLRWRDANGYTQLHNVLIACTGWPSRDGMCLPLERWCRQRPSGRTDPNDKTSKSRFDGQVMIVDKYGAKEALPFALYSSGTAFKKNSIEKENRYQVSSIINSRG